MHYYRKTGLNDIDWISPAPRSCYEIKEVKSWEFPAMIKNIQREIRFSKKNQGPDCVKLLKLGKACVTHTKKCAPALPLLNLAVKKIRILILSLYRLTKKWDGKSLKKVMLPSSVEAEESQFPDCEGKKKFFTAAESKKAFPWHWSPKQKLAYI